MDDRALRFAVAQPAPSTAVTKACHGTQLRSLDVALFEPEIPANAGNIARLCAAMASECAAEQGRFAAFHQQLFEQQDSIGIKSFEEFGRAARVQDLESFQTCLEEERYTNNVRANIREGERIGIRATPSLIIDGELYEGAPPVAVIEQLLAEQLKQ